MHQGAMRTLTNIVVAVGLCALAAPAHAGTLFVANNGVDVAKTAEVTGCGPKASPCRSISQAIANAVTFDTIIVGPGRYGDLDVSGILGDAAGEEKGTQCFSFPCFLRNTMIDVNRTLIIKSSHGAAETVIDARTLDLATTVTMTAGGEFGRPGQGFTVTWPRGSPRGEPSTGISIDSAEVKVRGNQVIATASAFFPENGIYASGPGPVLIEGNQVVGWEVGIRVTGEDKTIRKNQVSLNFLGIWADEGSSDAQVLQNIATANNFGIEVSTTVDVVGNAVNGNWINGVTLGGSLPPSSFQKNNLVGNGFCGVDNHHQPLLLANNYWGAATGPGADPADDVCESFDPSTTTPFATKPFSVIAPIEP